MASDLEDDSFDMDTEVDGTDAAIDDFAASRDLNTGNLNLQGFDKTLSTLGTTDSNLRNVFVIIETIRQQFGDKDRLLATFADELQQSLLVTMRELQVRPSRAAARYIRVIENDSERDQAIDEFLKTAVQFVELIKNDGLRNQWRMHVEMPAKTL